MTRRASRSTAWGHELKKKGRIVPTADALFLPITAAASAEAALPEAAMNRPVVPDPQIELMLANGRCLRFAPDLDPTTLVGLTDVVRICYTDREKTHRARIKFNTMEAEGAAGGVTKKQVLPTLKRVATHGA